MDETVNCRLGGTVDAVKFASIKLLYRRDPLHHLLNSQTAQVNASLLRTTLLRRCLLSQDCLTFCQEPLIRCADVHRVWLPCNVSVLNAPQTDTGDSALLFASCFTHIPCQLVDPSEKSRRGKVAARVQMQLLKSILSSRPSLTLLRVSNAFGEGQTFQMCVLLISNVCPND